MDITDEGDPRLKFTIERLQAQLVRLDAQIVERRTELQMLERELQNALHHTPRRFSA
jgi:chaperonin cofactor prefoldin